MEMLFKLYSRQGSYTDPKTGGVRITTHYFVAPSSEVIDPLHPEWKKLIGININYFADPKTGVDPRYSGRKQIFDMFATPLAPAKPSDGVQSQEASASVSGDVLSGVSSGIVSGIPEF